MEKDHLEILLEDMRGNFQLVLEGHEVLRHDIQDLARETKERFEVVDLKFEALNTKIDSVDERLNNKIDAVDKKLSDKIDAVDKKLSDKIDAVDKKLSDKIDAVDKNLSNHIDAVAADLKAHRADTEVHHGIYRIKEN